MSEPDARRWKDIHARLAAVTDRIDSGFAPDIAQQREILHQRAQTLARPPESETKPSSLDVVVFTLGKERYAVESSFVDEVQPLEAMTKVPGVPSFVTGIMNLRGTMLTLLDIKEFFDLPRSGITDVHKIIIVRNKDVQAGLIADKLIGVQTIPIGDLQESLPTLTGIRADYLRGVTAGCLVILDLQKLLGDERLTIKHTTA
ncbi:MAG: purine-binding chemotaxis protein CheW [Chthoniobacter sp.]|jgi:purine-binding chemotaxis protein CheW|nr:purine-binding chemotaxis protein CheW [Chthoniobacter sp.]